MRQTLLVVLTILIAIAASAPPVLAEEFVSAVHLDFRNANARGQVLVHNIDADGARITIALGRLLPGRRYRLIFTTDGCATPLASAQRIARVRFGANDDGAAFTSALVGTDGGIWREARSARLMEEEGIFYFCRAVSVLDEPDPGEDADGAWARFRSEIRGLLGLHVDTSEILLTLTGLRPSTKFRLVHSPLTCKQFEAGEPDAPTAVSQFRSNPAGISFARLAIEAGESIALTTGSFRVERRSNRVAWGCANANAFTVWMTVG